MVPIRPTAMKIAKFERAKSSSCENGDGNNNKIVSLLRSDYCSRPPGGEDAHNLGFQNLGFLAPEATVFKLTDGQKPNGTKLTKKLHHHW